MRDPMLPGIVVKDSQPRSYECDRPHHLTLTLRPAATHCTCHPTDRVPTRRPGLHLCPFHNVHLVTSNTLESTTESNV
jgi:hypothetical protein